MELVNLQVIHGNETIVFLHGHSDNDLAYLNISTIDNPYHIKTRIDRKYGED